MANRPTTKATGHFPIPAHGHQLLWCSNTTACHQHVLNNHANETKGLSHNFLKNINKHLPSLLEPELGPSPQSCPLGSGSPAERSGVFHTGCRYVMLEGSSCRQVSAKHPFFFSLRGPVFGTATEAAEPPEASQVGPQPFVVPLRRSQFAPSRVTKSHHSSLALFQCLFRCFT